VAEQHDVGVHAVHLVKVGAIPKTSSGKVQRRACRARFLADALEAAW
jgi:acyl-CoA synthetase (AMP-forming)/AMP-acid ligase II